MHAASFRSTRGYTTVAALLDEVAIWPCDELSAEPDVEVINSIRPGMATIPDAMLLCRQFTACTTRRALGCAPPVLRPRRSRRVGVAGHHARHERDRAAELDRRPTSKRPSTRQLPITWRNFRNDLEGFISRDAVMECVVPGLRERPPDRRVRHHAFVDPSGGSTDSFTLCIGHNDIARRTVILDAIREVKAPFSPEAVVAEFSKVLKSYNVLSVTATTTPRNGRSRCFRRHGIRYTQDAQPKSDLYAGSLLPLINSRRIELFDLPSLIGQICSLERSTRHGACREDRSSAPWPRRRRQRGCRSGGALHAHRRLRSEPPRSIRRRSGRAAAAHAR